MQFPDRITFQSWIVNFRAEVCAKEECSQRTIGPVQDEKLIVFYTCMPRETVRTTWNEVERRKKFSPGASFFFSTVSEERD